MDFSSICRFCFRSLRKKKLQPIFNIKLDVITYSATILNATSVSVQYNDNLPQHYCRKCEKYLKNTIDFQKQCKHTETKLLQIIKTYEHSLKTNETDSKTNETLLKTNESFERNETVLPDMKIKNEFCNNKIKNKEINNIKYDNNVGIKDESLDTIYEEENIFCDPLIVTKNNLKTENINRKFEKTFPDISDEIINGFKTDLKTDSILNINNCLTSEKSTKDSTFETNTIVLPTTNITEELPEFTEILPKNGQKRVKCVICLKNLSPKSVYSHMSKLHSHKHSIKLKCKLSDTYLSDKEVDKLNKRNINNLDYKSRLDTCDVCGKMMLKSSIRVHKQMKHSNMRPVCGHCGKDFGNKNRLKEHLRAKHGYEKFKCTFCEYTSAIKLAMQNHERRHRGEKPYVCETCGAVFHARYLLAQHKHSHRNDKTVNCDKCPAVFKSNNSLHMHKQACHTSAYTCGICERKYTCKMYVVRHLRLIHKFEGTEPPIKEVMKDN